VVTGLKEAGADVVLVTTLPSATGPILGTAAQLKYGPTWIGSTPAWIDGFFNPEVIPGAVFGNFYWMSGLPYWGEDVPGMAEFIKTFKAHGGADAKPDFYVLLSYVQGLVQIEAARRAIESGDITRAGYIEALHSLKRWNAGGLIQPINLSKVPYVTGTQTRVLKPDMKNNTWTVAAPYAEPKHMKKGPAKKADGKAGKKKGKAADL